MVPFFEVFFHTKGAFTDVAAHNEGIMTSSAAPNSYVKALTRTQSHAENKDYFMMFISFLFQEQQKFLSNHVKFPRLAE